MSGTALYILDTDEANLLHNLIKGIEMAAVPVFTTQDIGKYPDENNEEIETYWLLEYSLLTNEYIRRNLQ